MHFLLMKLYHCYRNLEMSIVVRVLEMPKGKRAEKMKTCYAEGLAPKLIGSLAHIDGMFLFEI